MNYFAILKSCFFTEHCQACHHHFDVFRDQGKASPSAHSRSLSKRQGLDCHCGWRAARRGNYKTTFKALPLFDENGAQIGVVFETATPFAPWSVPVVHPHSDHA